MKLIKNKPRTPKVGDRVTVLGNNPLRWGTVVKVTDLRTKQLRVTGSKRHVVRIVWDHLPNRECLESASMLFYDGDKPIQLRHKGDVELVDPKRKQ